MFFFFYDEETGETGEFEVDNSQFDSEEDMEAFYDSSVRRIFHKQEEQWYFSIVDVCGVLTESTDPASYWRKLKQRLIEEGNETVTNCHRFKLKDNPRHISLARHSVIPSRVIFATIILF